MLPRYELIAGITGQSAFNARLRCPFTLLGAGERSVPSVAAPPRFDTRPGQRCMRCHVGRQAAEVARWWSLHEGLHVATQVPAQLVGSAAACERRQRLGWRGPGSGPAGTLGEGLVGWPGKGLARWPDKGVSVARCCPRQGPCRGSCVFPRQEPCRGSLPSNPHLILSILCLRKYLHATMEVPPEPCPNVVVGVGDRGIEGGSLLWCGRAVPTRVLLGLPRQGSLPGKPASSIRSLWPWSLMLLCLSRAFGFSPDPLLCPAMRGRGTWL